MHTIRMIFPGFFRIVFMMTLLCAAVFRAAAEEDAPTPSPAASEPTLSDKAGRALEATRETAQEAWKVTKEKSKEIYQNAREATRDGIAWLDGATYDARAECSDRLTKLGDGAGEKIAEWKAGAKELTPAARERLDKALADFRLACRELGQTSGATWDVAKARAGQSWTALQKALRNPDSDTPAPSCREGGEECRAAENSTDGGGAVLEN